MFDRLYLDMNGIIHNCSHPNDDNGQFRITEEVIFQGIIDYIETLFRIIRPRKLQFLPLPVLCLVLHSRTHAMPSMS